MNSVDYTIKLDEELNRIKQLISVYAKVRTGKVVYNLARLGWTSDQIMTDALCNPETGKPMDPAIFSKNYSHIYEKGRQEAEVLD